MPLNYIGTLLTKGPDNTPGWHYIRKYGPPLLVTTLLKLYFSGSSSGWEADLHGKVYIVTGGTSGIGATLVREMAARGAQLVLLTSQLQEDNSGAVWVTDYVRDLRESTRNPLIYVEQCDLSSLYSVRKFATKWLDSKAPRRLDGIVCLASETVPVAKERELSIDGVERQIAVNYLGHYQLLTLLIPVIKSQPPDRNVRIILTTCSTQALGTVDMNDIIWEKKRYPKNMPWKVHGSSKLMLFMFAKEFQRRLEEAQKKTRGLCTVRVNMVNPGMTRTPSMRRFISMGTILGLLLYLLFYPIFWVFLKSCESGMQSHLYALSYLKFDEIRGGNYIRECRIISAKLRKELQDEQLQKKLYDKTAERIGQLERSSAIERNRSKKPKKTTIKKRDKKIVSQKKQPNKLSEQQRLGLFKTAFENPIDVYPPMEKNNNNSANQDKVSEAKNIQLKRLEQKYEASRRRLKEKTK